MAYDAGEAFLRIVPSFAGVAESISREAAKWGLGAGQSFADSFNRQVRDRTNNAPLGPSTPATVRQGEAAGKTFADGFKAKIETALRSLPKIELNADSTAADARIASIRENLKELSGQRIGIDINEADAIAKIEILHRQLTELATETPSIAVRADTVNAARQLDQLRLDILKVADSDPTVDVRADTGDADAKLAATKAAADDLNHTDASPNVSVDTGPALAGIGIIKTALLGLSAGAVITPVLGGLGALLGPLSAVGLGGGALVGASLPGLSNIKNVLTDESKPQSGGSGQSASASAAAQVAAANQIKAAKLSLADTERRVANDEITSAQSVKTAETAVATARTSSAAAIATAARNVVTAEQGVVTAQRASLAAQQALSAAREAAARSLQDSAFSVQDAQLTLQADQFAITQAQQNLDAVNASSTSTDLQKQEAVLALAQAQQALTEQQVTAQRATEDNTKAQAAGVNGSNQVVTAASQVASTQKGVVTATQAVTAAQAAQATAAKTAAATIKTAEQGLADARRAQAFQEANDASSLVAAHQAVASAQLAAANSANKQSTASSNLGAALAKLTPQEEILLNSVKQFKKTFTEFGDSLEPVTLPLFAGGIKILTDLLPKLEPLIRATASALGDVEKSFAKAVNGPGATKFLDTMTKLAGPSIKDLATLFGNLGGIIAHLAETFAPLSGQVLGGLDSISASLSKASQSPGLKAFVKTIGEIGPLFNQTLGSVGGLLGKLVGALAPLAGPVLSVINTLAKALSTLVAGLAGPLKQAFSQLAPILNQLIKELLPILTKSFASIISAVPSLAKVFVELILAVAPLLPIIANIIAAVVKFIASLSPNELLGAIVAVGAAALALSLAFDAIPVVVGLIVAAIVAAAALIVDNWSTIQPVVQPVLDLFKQIWDFIKNVLVPVIEGILKDALAGLKAGFGFVADAIKAHRAQLDQLKNAFVDIVGFIVKDVLPIFGPILKVAFEAVGLYITGVIDVISFLVDAFNGLVRAGKDVGKWFAGPFVNFFKAAAKDVKDAFGDVTGFFSSMWHDVEKVFAKAVNWITRDVLNPLIGVLNDVLGIFGIKIKPFGVITVSPPSATSATAPTAPHGHGTGYSTGGVLPGYAPGRDSLNIWASPGEGILVPEAVRGIGGASGVQQLNAMFSGRVPSPGSGSDGSGGAMFGIGGVIGDIGDALGSALSSVIGDVEALAAKGALALLNTGEAPMRAALGDVGGLAAKMGNGLLDKINTEVKKFITGHTSATVGGGFTGGSIPTGQHKSLIDQALGLAGVASSPGNESAVNTIVVNESGWNPNAVNRVDSNAQAGHPSTGLMQTIIGTFEAYRLGSLPDDMTNPLADLVAGIRYAVSRYGSLGNVPGVVGVANGSGYVGYDSGGFIPPGVSTVFNGTGRPEPVFTSAQWDMLAKGSSGDMTVIAQFGDETVKAQAHRVLDSRLSAATERSQRGVPGGVLAQLAH